VAFCSLPDGERSTALIKDNQNDRFHPASPEERQIKIAEIVAEGVYSYLKKNSFLKEDIGRERRIGELLENTKRVEIHNMDVEELQRVTDVTV
jgi:hypothetical protein